MPITKTIWHFVAKRLNHNKTKKLISYISVGLLCAFVYAGTLITLRQFIPVWLANPGAFLAGSLTGGVFHSKLTFRRETQGKPFAKRWITTQYLMNLGVCTWLPLIMPASIDSNTQLLVLVFTPTILNAVIWSRAASFNQRRLPRH